MKKITCLDPDGYRGFEQNGDELVLEEGATIDVTDEKHAQLVEDFPDRFDAAGKAHKPKRVAGGDEDGEGK